MNKLRVRMISQYQRFTVDGVPHETYRIPAEGWAIESRLGEHDNGSGMPWAMALVVWDYTLPTKRTDEIVGDYKEVGHRAYWIDWNCLEVKPDPAIHFGSYVP